MDKNLDSTQTVTLVVVLLAIIFCFSAGKFIWTAQCFEPVEAVFKEYEWETGRKHVKEAAALYTYRYGGQSYSGHPLNTPFILDKKPGMSCIIYVNPSHPEYFTDILWYLP